MLYIYQSWTCCSVYRASYSNMPSHVARMVQLNPRSDRMPKFRYQRQVTLVCHRTLNKVDESNLQDGLLSHTRKMGIVTLLDGGKAMDFLVV